MKNQLVSIFQQTNFNNTITVGHIIHGTMGIAPLFVRKEGKYEKQPACVRAQNSEPWYVLN